MTWIKQNYDRFVLALFAATLTACAALLFINAHSFNSVFDVLKSVPNPNNTIPPFDSAALDNERQKLANPAVWKPRQQGDHYLPVFVSVPYIEASESDGKGGFTPKLMDPYQGGMVHPPVPNEWLIKYSLDMINTNVLNQDTDLDGFTTLEEWMGHTDPTDKNSHPPYYTKLYLKQFVRVPFRLLFAARNGKVMLINTIDIEDAPTQFLHEGDLVKGTKFKVLKLEIKSGNVNGITKDTSEVTLENTETKERIVLPKETEVDSPTTYAVLTYLWTGGDLAGKPDFRVNKNQEFTLKPEANVKYKCLSLSDTVVTIVKEDENKTLDITLLPRK